MTNLFGKSSMHLADKTKPLGKNQWCWEKPQQKAFPEVKDEISKSPVLAQFEPGQETTVSADASLKSHFLSSFEFSLTPGPLSEKSRRGLVTHLTLPCPRGINQLCNHVLMLIYVIKIEGVHSSMACVIGSLANTKLSVVYDCVVVRH